MSIFVTLLINLLVSFLTQLFERWLGLKNELGVTAAENPVLPPPQFIKSNKDAFLAKVKPRFWLGAKRMERADKAFDLAVGSYGLKLGIGVFKGVDDPSHLAEAMTQGVGETL